ncbi:MAG: lytic transglycosylase domain-containing protein [Rhodobacteraceae bacterium]|nr:lytic transglycosylase domain-containing protein [Paracoccaceae bacterium]
MRAARFVVFCLGLGLAAQAAAAQIMRPVPRPDRDAAVSGTLVLSSKTPVPRPANLLTGHELRLALAAARRGDWDHAGKLARSDGAVAANIIEWQRLRAGKGSFAEYRVFLDNNGDWPGLKLLRRKGEASIPEGSAFVHVIAYFKPQPPQTGRGALRLSQAYAALGEEAKARAELVRVWKTLKMTASAETAILQAHGPVVASFHAARLDLALWGEDIAFARRMLPRVDDAHRKLAEARLALQRGSGKVDRLIRAVPDALADDPGLARDRMGWQIAMRQRGKAADIILLRSVSAASLGRPEAWADWRRILARQEMRAGNGQRAYDLASTHFLQPGSDFADLEWLSGYLALRYLKNPARALEHFERFRTAVYTPISLGRAGYWQGRAHDALGDAEAAQAAWRDAALYQTSFYGQLAAERAGVAMTPALTGRTGFATWRGTGFSQSAVFKAARLFDKAGQDWETSRFLRHLAETADPGELVALADFALSLGDPYLAVRVAKKVAREGTVAHRAYYPLTSLGPETLPVPRELALSIARRESEFFAAAVSGAGARGLMQLMPGTAKQMAAKLGLPYAKSRLITDPVYNATLGSAYLAHLIDEFGSNIVLVSVGYNAGPHRARRWIETFGDLRTPGVDAIDWIEHIPFRETRNYVMRVAESMAVYRARLTGKPAPFALSAELKAR